MVSAIDSPVLLGMPVYAPSPSETPAPEQPATVTAATRGAAVFFSHGDPMDIEQYMLEMVNRGRMDPTGEADRFGIDLNQDLAAGTISPTPKPPVAFNPNLMQAARGHSQWMLDAGIFSHNGEDGSTLRDRTNAAGYPEFSSVGENIAWRGTTGAIEDELIAFAEAEIRGLFLSASHRVNTLRDVWVEVGIGCRTGPFPYEGDYYNALMTSVNFGTSDYAPKASPGSNYLTGVVYEDLDDNGFYTPGEGIPNVRIEPENGDFYTETSASGGYAVPIPNAPSTFKIVLSGSRWVIPARYDVAYEGGNVKLDVVYTTATVLVQSYGNGSPTPSGEISVEPDGVPLTEISAIPEENHFFLFWDDPNNLLNDAAADTTTITNPVSGVVTAVFTGGDYDADTLPDLWEYTYFGSLLPEPDGDDDGDGHTNAEEMLAELNPDFDDSDVDIITLHEGWNMFIPTVEMEGSTVQEAFGVRALPTAWMWDAQKRVFVPFTGPFTRRGAVWLYATETFAVTTAASP